MVHLETSDNLQSDSTSTLVQHSHERLAKSPISTQISDIVLPAKRVD